MRDKAIITVKFPLPNALGKDTRKVKNITNKEQDLGLIFNNRASAHRNTVAIKRHKVSPAFITQRKPLPLKKFTSLSDWGINPQHRKIKTPSFKRKRAETGGLKVRNFSRRCTWRKGARIWATRRDQKEGSRSTWLFWPQKVSIKSLTNTQKKKKTSQKYGNNIDRNPKAELRSRALRKSESRTRGDNRIQHKRSPLPAHRFNPHRGRHPF